MMRSQHLGGFFRYITGHQDDCFAALWPIIHLGANHSLDGKLGNIGDRYNGSLI